VEAMSENNVLRAVIVLKHGMTPAASKVLSTLPKVRFDTFTEAELLVNITEHQLVPKHVLLSLEEKKELLSR
jgi:DNA-directed RNA polymerases I, II, and III subunit RPABC1